MSNASNVGIQVGNLTLARDYIQVTTDASDNTAFILVGNATVNVMLTPAHVYINGVDIVANAEGTLVIDSVSNTSVVAAASANSVKTAYDAAQAAYANAASLGSTQAGAAYTNAVSNAVAIGATAYSNATSYADTKAAAAYTNAVSNAVAIAATAYSNAVAFAANGTNINSGTIGVAVQVGTSVVNSTAIAEGANVVITTSRVSVGNSTVNAAVNSTAFSINGAALPTSSPAGKNRIINGAMTIDQRGSGSNYVAPGNDTYTLDRWVAVKTGTGQVVDFRQSSTAPAGFSNSLRMTATTGGAAGSADFIGIGHRIEGYNVTDLVGTSGFMTLSFWISSPVTGNYSIRFGTGTTGYYYLASYTVNVANTWEQKTVTIPTNTSGTAVTNNAIGLSIEFLFVTGSTYTGGTSAWATGNASFVGLAGSVSNAFATTSNAVYMTGVQLEAGSSATPFERRSYGQELVLCQRYFEVMHDPFAQQLVTTGNLMAVAHPFVVQKRTTPTVTYITGTLTNCSMNVYVCTALAWSYYLLNTSGGNNNISLQNGVFTAAAEL